LIGAAPCPPRERRAERLLALWPDVVAVVRPRAGLLAVGLLLVGVGRAAALALPAATKLLVDEVIGRRRVGLLAPLALGVAAASILQAGVSRLVARVSARTTDRLIAELRCRLHGHVLRLPLLYHDLQQSGALGARVLGDAAGVTNLVGAGLLGFAGTLMTAAFALLIIARESATLAAAALVAVIVVAALSARSAGVARGIAHERGDIFADVAGRLTEALGGVRVLKAYRAEPREDDVFAAGMARVVANGERSAALVVRLGLVGTVAWGLANAAVIYAGAREILAGRLTLGGFFTVAVVLGYLAAPSLQISSIGTMIMEALAGLERMRALLREPREEDDPARTVALGPLRGEVELDHVSFAYDPGHPVLHDVCLRASPGTLVALCGPSGAGKSTLVGLVAAFYRPTAGRVLVDGVDLATARLSSYRAQIGVVLQETFLFDGTIWENIAFARPGASRAEVLAAARSAHVDAFVDALPDGYATRVGERGVRLSGGQRQRLSIARAILADPRILILDEATSNLDSASEALVQEALARLLVGRTTFVIAHRLSTIRRADRILVVDGGRVVEEGSHAALVRAGGRYAAMVRAQDHSRSTPT
jgi:subfamily B ATP-binding cassette protein MsbA